MAVTNTSNSIRLKTLVKKMRHDYPALSFVPGIQNQWSYKTQTITYETDKPDLETEWSLLHELAHALLEHKDYSTDFELLKLESEAWTKAQKLGDKYGIIIDPEHIQDSLDTYRDWLHKRSACPTCGLRSPQSNERKYTCMNCRSSWKVASDINKRPYRLTHTKTPASS